jgi:hypothetical protein
VVQLVNIMVSGPYALSFLKQLFGRIPDQSSPYLEDGHEFVNLVFRAFGALGIEKTSLIASMIGLSGLTVPNFLPWLRRTIHPEFIANASISRR